MMCLVGKGLLDLQNAPSSGDAPAMLPLKRTGRRNSWSLRPPETAAHIPSHILTSQLTGHPKDLHRHVTQVAPTWAPLRLHL